MTIQEGFGAMGNVTTAMRDPFFYRWHTMIDEIFVEFKNTLPPYTDAEVSDIAISAKIFGKSRHNRNYCDFS